MLKAWSAYIHKYFKFNRNTNQLFILIFHQKKHWNKFSQTLSFQLQFDNFSEIAHTTNSILLKTNYDYINNGKLFLNYTNLFSMNFFKLNQFALCYVARDRETIVKRKMCKTLWGGVEYIVELANTLHFVVFDKTVWKTWRKSRWFEWCKFIR